MKNWLYLFLAAALLAACNESSSTDTAASPPAAAPAGETQSQAAENYEMTAIPGADEQRAVLYDAEGNLKEEGMMLNGKKTGTWIVYHPGGEFPEKVISYAEGNYNGPYYEFNERGQIKLRASYINNKLDGPWAAYSFGRPTKKAGYKNGELEGTYMEFDMRTGKLQKEVNYKAGKQHGTYRFYDPDGNVMVEYEYENGEKVGGGVVGE